MIYGPAVNFGPEYGTENNPVELGGYDLFIFGPAPRKAPPDRNSHQAIRGWWEPECQQGPGGVGSPCRPPTPWSPDLTH